MTSSNSSEKWTCESPPDPNHNPRSDFRILDLSLTPRTRPADDTFPALYPCINGEATDGRAGHSASVRCDPPLVERKSARARLVDVSFYHPAPDARKWSARVGSTRPHIIVRASKGWCRAGSLVQTNGSVASAVEKALVFSHLPLTPRTRSSDHAR